MLFNERLLDANENLGKKSQIIKKIKFLLSLENGFGFMRKCPFLCYLRKVVKVLKGYGQKPMKSQSRRNCYWLNDQTPTCFHRFPFSVQLWQSLTLSGQSTFWTIVPEMCGSSRLLVSCSPDSVNTLPRCHGRCSQPHELEDGLQSVPVRVWASIPPAASSPPLPSFFLLFL